jgi:spore maturation protein CgeB
MKLVIFGLTISSAWGNGHATLWRGLCRALHAGGHDVVFFERDVPYYAHHRDFREAEWCRLVLYSDWNGVAAVARDEVASADAAIVTSYCPDGRTASRLVLESSVARKVFYDLDSPVTLDRVARGEPVAYLPEDGLGGFDLVLSYAGGAALDGLVQLTGAKDVAPLYGSVDPDVHLPVAPSSACFSDLSYLGTYAADRQAVLEELFIDPARARPLRRFALGGSQYPADFPWTSNIWYFSHVPPPAHPQWFCSSRLTLNITRGPMAAVGFCPSGRLFEATACGAAVITDTWQGLDWFFRPREEILVARSTVDVLDALELSDQERQRIGAAARERTLTSHTAAVRARELVQLLEREPWRHMGAA